MDVKVVSGDIVTQRVGAIVVNLFEGVTAPGGATGAVDRALNGAIVRLIEDGEIRGEKGELTLIHTLGTLEPSRVLVAGLGKASDFDLDGVRTVSAEVCRYLRRKGIRHVATVAHGGGIGGIDPGAAAQAVAEGAVLGLYRFDRYRSDDKDKREMEEMAIVEIDPSKVAAMQDAVAEGVLVADATNLCRDLANEPANVMTPTQLAEAALEVANQSGMEIDVLDRPRMAELGMGALLGVAQGSEEPPKLIILHYKGDPSDPKNNCGLLGKGITFDTGGISIKPSANMGVMKGDMAGGAAVIGAMKAIGSLKPKINVTGVIAAAENMLGGKAQRPGDIVKAMNGKTIEIENTDAEGRLVLADAIAYARSLGLGRLVDVATLTGAMSVALGNVFIGAFGNDQDLIDRVVGAGKRAGERMWQMPSSGDYKEQYKSAVADLKNTGGRPAGSITGAQFIGEFAEGVPWVHLDIAATSRTNSDKGWNPRGATGVSVRTLVRLAQNLAGPEPRVGPRE